MTGRLSTLRARVVAASVLGTLVVLLVAAALLLASTRAGEQNVVDQRLARRADLAASTVASAPGHQLPGKGLLLALTDLGVEVRWAGSLTDRVGTLPPQPAPAPQRVTAARTVTVDGEQWRAVARPIPDAPSGSTVQVLTPLSTAEEPVARLRRRLLVAGAAGLALAALVAWLLGRAATTALDRLRRAADDVAATERLDLRVPAGGPREVAAVADALNAMLAAIERSATQRDRALDATRRFAADAGHELRTPLAALQTELETLERHPELPEHERAAILADALSEQQRLSTLVAALQALTRAEGGQLGDEQPVDLAALAREAIAALPATTDGGPAAELLITGAATGAADGEPGAVTVPHASPTGVRLLLDNLLRNARQHGAAGRAEARVRLTIDAAPQAITLRVEDDGPGIAAGEREAVLRRFVRGSGARGDGSGLGLAIVAQQATLLGGELTIGGSDALGGAQLQVSIPLAPQRAAAGVGGTS